ncbi:hypothetical protein ACFQ4O_07075 [Methylopila musalis]|uniref:SGNH/GDSL hydrolase family protein n=1 Tax=Methylopila musalis TaxID=1134781 RepID=A0ABW3Z6D9_9HYPH
MRRLLVLGDSHVQYFNHAARLGLFAPYEFESKRVTGSTASGLTNAKSFTAARPAFLGFLSDKPKNATIVLHLGEVDCGILVWVRAGKNGTAVEDEIARSIASYMTFVDELLNDGWSDIIVTSATLPTINDTDHAGEVASVRRRAVTATFVERTWVTHFFNARLEAETRARGLTFVDASPAFLDSDTGVVNTIFRNQNPADHHMDNLQAGPVWAALIDAALGDDEDVEPRRVLVARQPTAIKTGFKHSKRLPANLVRHVPANARIEARICARRGANLALAGVRSDDIALHPWHRIVCADHWEDIGEVAPAIRSPADPAPPHPARWIGKDAWIGLFNAVIDRGRALVPGYARRRGKGAPLSDPPRTHGE